MQALRAAHIDAEVTDIVPCAPATRRRVTFSARKTERGVVFGFNRAHSNEIVDIAECPISLPEIVASLDRLRVLAGMISATPQPFHMTVTATASGLDIAAEGAGKLGEGRRRAVSEFVVREGFARLSVDGEIIIEPRKPAMVFGDIGVPVPPGAFLQATAFAEQAMADLVLQHLSRAKKVADLFAGCGSFALRLARKAEVHAVEGDAAALAALDRGFRQATGLKRVTSERRDLFRRPLTFKELNVFDGVRVRSAARRRGGPVQADRQIGCAVRGGGVVQSRHARARPRDPRRRRLPRHKRHADRPVPLVAACRGRGIAGEAEEKALA